MSYKDGTGNNAQLLARTLRGVMDFSGRSRRTEVLYYWIACALLGVVLGPTMGLLLPYEIAIWTASAVQLLLSIPLFALFVRRLHDQNRSGWLGLLLPLSILLNIPRRLALAHDDVVTVIGFQTTPLGLASSTVVLVILVLYFLPGTNGPNRFGPDPRLEEV